MIRKIKEDKYVPIKDWRVEKIIKSEFKWILIYEKIKQLLIKIIK